MWKKDALAWAPLATEGLNMRQSTMAAADAAWEAVDEGHTAPGASRNSNGSRTERGEG